MPKKKSECTPEEWEAIALKRKNYKSHNTDYKETHMCEEAQHWLAHKWSNRKRKFISPTLGSYYIEWIS